MAINLIKNFFLKDLKGLYAAEQLRNVYKNNNLSEIIEIGAGIGYTCHYLKQMINTKYTIYNLPFSSILQAIYLMISYGENNVHLDNEKLPNKKVSNKKIVINIFLKFLASFFSYFFQISESSPFLFSNKKF